jgi:hypothetical protein
VGRDFVHLNANPPALFSSLAVTDNNSPNSADLRGGKSGYLLPRKRNRYAATYSQHRPGATDEKGDPKPPLSPHTG